MDYDVILAKIVVEKSTIYFDQFFDYIVPKDLVNAIQKGSRVIVPFGNSNKKCQGLIFDIYKKSVDIKIFENLKEIYKIVDESPLINEEMFSIIHFLKINTFCTYYDAIKTILPSGISFEISKIYKMNEEINVDDMILTDIELKTITFLNKSASDKKLNMFLSKLGLSKIKSNNLIKDLISRNIIQFEDIVKRKIRTSINRFLMLNPNLDYKTIKLSSKQVKVLDFMSVNIKCSLKEICYNCTVTDFVIKSLITKGLIQYCESSDNCKKNIVFKAENMNFNKIFELNFEQKKILDSIYEQYCKKSPNVGLVHGVTGSGKTYIFMELIEKILKQGKQVIFLVPEISLTSQIVTTFKSVFGNNISIIHSGLTPKDRVLEWEKIKNGESNIIIGTRSAVFSPVKNLGIIIIDEEGEYSYKSENAPRYHTRDIAKLRCLYHNTILLLSSATPSIESYYNAERGRYSLYKITKRYSKLDLPKVKIVDTKDNIFTKSKSYISCEIISQLIYNFENSNQSIVFINRRGHSSYIVCFSCDYNFICKNCSASMTYHKINNSMICHYCGNVQKFPKICPQCKCEVISLKGVGTQKLEEEISQLLPNSKILRIDSDTIYSKSDYEEKFNLFLDNKYDIMVGTQMIAKGLNFPNVTMVCVLEIDSLINSDDFRCNERAFSLITQAIGRSGRGFVQGRAYIQTNLVENDIITLASNQNYETFYKQEILFRKHMLYPPYCDICVLGISSKNENDGLEASKFILGELINKIKSEYLNIPIKILGISTPSVHKLNNKYRFRIVIKCKANRLFKNLINNLLIGIGKNARFKKNISLFVDINGDLNY